MGVWLVETNGVLKRQGVRALASTNDVPRPLILRLLPKHLTISFYRPLVISYPRQVTGNQ
jgi:hypothetical protein